MEVESRMTILDPNELHYCQTAIWTCVHDDSPPPPKKKSLGTLNPKRRSWLRVGAALTAREGNDEGAADRPPLAKATMRAPRPKNLF